MFRLLTPLAILAASALLVWYVFVERNTPEATAQPIVSVNPDSDWYPQRDWTHAQPGKLNISVFVYRDRNQDGIYDTGDVPMAAVAVLLTRPDGTHRMARTNINGYANFDVMAGNMETDIAEAGKPHRFEVQVPPAWHVTSGNAGQTSTFALLPGAPAGMVTRTPPAVIGLAPELTASGTVAPGTLAEDALVAVGPNGERIPIDPDGSGHFRFVVKAGDWSLQQADGDNRQLLKIFTVRDAPVVLGTIGRPSDARESGRIMQTLDFEEFKRSIIEKLAHGHLGLSWDYLLAVDNQHYQGPGYVNVLASGHMVGYNSSGYPVTVRGAQPGERFDFVGAYFGTAWPGAEGETLHLDAYRDGQRVHADTLPLSHLGPVWFQADYVDIDELRLHTAHYWQFVTDDMHFHVAPKSSSPKQAGALSPR